MLHALAWGVECLGGGRYGRWGNGNAGRAAGFASALGLGCRFLRFAGSLRQPGRAPKLIPGDRPDARRRRSSDDQLRRGTKGTLPRSGARGAPLYWLDRHRRAARRRSRRICAASMRMPSRGPAMSLAERLRRAYLRWSRLGVAGLLLLPIIATSLLGFLWLHERGFLLVFVLGCAGLALSVWSGRFVLRWNGRRKARAVAVDADGEAGEGASALRERLEHPAIDPDWSARETAIFEAARKAIAARLENPFLGRNPAANTRSPGGGGCGRGQFRRQEGRTSISPCPKRAPDRPGSRSATGEFLRSNVPFLRPALRAGDLLVVDAAGSGQGRLEVRFISPTGGGSCSIPAPVAGLLRELGAFLPPRPGCRDRLTDQVMRYCPGVRSRRSPRPPSISIREG